MDGISARVPRALDRSVEQDLDVRRAGADVAETVVLALAAFLEPETTNRTTLEEQIAYATMIAPKLTIQGGTTEILRGIIARGLGLR